MIRLMVSYLLMLISIGMGHAIQGAMVPTWGIGAQLFDTHLQWIAGGAAIALMLSAFVGLGLALRHLGSFLKKESPVVRAWTLGGVALLALAGACMVQTWTHAVIGDLSVVAVIVRTLNLGGQLFALVMATATVCLALQFWLPED